MTNTVENEAAYQGGDPMADRRRKLSRLRDEMSVAPYGHRTDDLIDLLGLAQVDLYPLDGVTI